MVSSTTRPPLAYRLRPLIQGYGLANRNTK
jgi:hypothetical protein